MLFYGKNVFVKFVPEVDSVLSNLDFSFLNQLLHGLLTLERDEPEVFACLGYLINGQFELNDFAELLEELLNRLVRQFRLQSADKDFA